MPNQQTVSGNSGKMSKTFQKKLVLYNLLVIICIASAVSYYNYRSYYKDVITNETRNSVNRVSTLSERLELAYQEMVNIVMNCADRKSLYFATTLSSESGSENPMRISASNVLKDFCAISGYSEYIHKLILYYNGTVLGAGNSNGSSDDVDCVRNAPWFAPLLSQSSSSYQLTLEKNPFSLGKFTDPFIIPLLRPLAYQYNQAPEQAWVFLGISSKLFSYTLQGMPAGHIMYITTASGDIVADLNGSRYDSRQLIDSLTVSDDLSGSFHKELNGEACVVTWQKQLHSGIMVIEILPVADMNLDHQVITSTIAIIFFFCIAIGLTLSLFISRQLGAPVSRLARKLQLISQGYFERDMTIETDDEIGFIGSQINEMSERISTLLDTRVQSEKEKKDLEIKMLQAQINPHFLYNTLDSIKWIATMQKNSGIVQVVTALSSLLKNMAKGFNEKVTLRQELDFLENYVIIEKIRYIELFDVQIDIDKEELFDARIIKLTLQPLVENAIFSGIEPSGRSGLIRIHAYTQEGVLYVSVTDNGIGISQDNIGKLLTDTARVSRSNMSGIGLPNVDRRIKLVYGDSYGLAIESKLDEYTAITVSLPLEF